MTPRRQNVNKYYDITLLTPDFKVEETGVLRMQLVATFSKAQSYEAVHVQLGLILNSGQVVGRSETNE